MTSAPKEVEARLLTARAALYVELTGHDYMADLMGEERAAFEELEAATIMNYRESLLLGFVKSQDATLVAAHALVREGDQEVERLRAVLLDIAALAAIRPKRPSIVELALAAAGERPGEGKPLRDALGSQ